jgi:hypothetical protein
LFSVQNEVNPDHLYREVKREPKVFQPLQIPRALQAELPYHLKPKVCGEEAVRLFTCMESEATTDLESFS